MAKQSSRHGCVPVFGVFHHPIGSAILAAGKQHAWTLIQCLCFIVSFAPDRLPVHRFRRGRETGASAFASASVIGESFLIVGGIALAPRGVMDCSVLRTVALTLLSGAVMAAVDLALKDKTTPFIAALVAVSAYVPVALISGAITRSQRDAVLGLLRRKFGRSL